jgi:hypothetical protein
MDLSSRLFDTGPATKSAHLRAINQRLCEIKAYFENLPVITIAETASYN